MKKAATARISSQAFLPRKVITSPAVRKAKLTIAPRTLGRMEATFLPSSFRLFPTPLATDFRPFERELMITPIVVPTATKTAVTVKPYFFKISFTRSCRDKPFLKRSLSFSWALRYATFSSIFHESALGSKVQRFCRSKSHNLLPHFCKSRQFLNVSAGLIHSSGPREFLISFGRFGFSLCLLVPLSTVNRLYAFLP